MLQDLEMGKCVGTYVHMYVPGKDLCLPSWERAGREADVFVTCLEVLFSPNPLLSLAGSQGRRSQWLSCVESVGSSGAGVRDSEGSVMRRSQEGCRLLCQVDWMYPLRWGVVGVWLG